jgi:hypothetical protein
MEIKDENIIVPDAELEQLAVTTPPEAKETKPNIGFYVFEWTLYLGLAFLAFRVIYILFK